MTRDEFAKDAESAYQQIVDLIDRFQKIDAAIVASNAATKINTSYGEFTVAGAISLRSRLRGAGSYDGDADFESALQNKMEHELAKRLEVIETKNRQLRVQIPFLNPHNGENRQASLIMASMISTVLCYGLTLKH